MITQGSGHWDTNAYHDHPMVPGIPNSIDMCIYTCVCVYLISMWFFSKPLTWVSENQLPARQGFLLPPSSSSQLWVPSSPASSRLSFLRAHTFGKHLIKAHTRWAPVQSNSRYDKPIVYMNRPLRHEGMKPFLISYLFRTLHAVASVPLLKFCWFFIHLPCAWHILKRGTKKKKIGGPVLQNRLVMGGVVEEGAAVKSPCVHVR